MQPFEKKKIKKNASTAFFLLYFAFNTDMVYGYCFNTFFKKKPV